MNIKTLKMALVLAAILALIGGAFSKQIVPMSIAAEGSADRQSYKLMKDQSLFKVRPEHRQQAIAWGLMNEIKTQLGPKKAKKIRSAETPSELHAYLQRVVNDCKKQQKKCPIANAAIAGHNGKAKGMKDKHYGKTILSGARSFEASAMSDCTDPPESQCSVMECLGWGGTPHIGPCPSECGGFDPQGPACPNTPGNPFPDVPETW